MIERKHKLKRVTERFKIELIEMALRKIHSQLSCEGELKATLADLIRLVEAHNELEQKSAVKEVSVRWVEAEPIVEG